MDSERYTSSEEIRRQEGLHSNNNGEHAPSSEEDKLDVQLDTQIEQRKRGKKKKKNSRSEMWSDDEEYDVVEVDRARKRNKKRRPNDKWQMDEWDD